MQTEMDTMNNNQEDYFEEVFIFYEVEKEELELEYYGKTKNDEETIYEDEDFCKFVKEKYIEYQEDIQEDLDDIRYQTAIQVDDYSIF